MKSFVVSPATPDIESSVRLINRSFSQEEPGRCALLLDLATAGMPSAAGLGELVALHKRLLQSGGTLVLCNVGDAWNEVLEATQLNKLLVIRPSTASTGLGENLHHQNAAKTGFDENLHHQAV